MTRAGLASLGVGIGADAVQLASLLSTPDRSLWDYVEVYESDLSVRPSLARDLAQCAVPVLVHGSGLSPLGVDAIPRALVRRTAHLAARVGAEWVVEDAAVWRIDGKGSLTAPFFPPIFSNDSLDVLVSRLPLLQEALGRPFVCEFPPLDAVIGRLHRMHPFRYWCVAVNACSPSTSVMCFCTPN